MTGCLIVQASFNLRIFVRITNIQILVSTPNSILVTNKSNKENAEEGNLKERDGNKYIILRMEQEKKGEKKKKKVEEQP